MFLFYINNAVFLECNIYSKAVLVKNLFDVLFYLTVKSKLTS